MCYVVAIQDREWKYIINSPSLLLNMGHTNYVYRNDDKRKFYQIVNFAEQGLLCLDVVV